MSAVDRELDRFVTFAFAAADLLLEVERDGLISYAAGATERFCGRTEAEVTGQRLDVLLGGADVDLVTVMLGQIRLGERRGPLAVTSADGKLVGEMRAFSALARARIHLIIAGIKVSTASPGRMAGSGLVDGDHFRAMVEGHLATGALQQGDLKLSLINLDGMEALVDNEPAAQELKRTVGALLRMHSTNGDAAGELAQDRFAVLHDGNVTSAELGAKIESLVANSSLVGQLAVAWQSLPLRNSSLSTEQSLQAMAYVLSGFAKRSLEVGQCESLGQAMQDSLAETAQRIVDVRRTIKQNAFDLAYQPIVSLADKKVHHYEALSRFRDAQGPSSLITFAEEVGLICDLDLAVMGKVVSYILELGSKATRPTIAVNLSARSLASDRFVETMSRLCRSTGHAARQLCFELTESAEILDLERMNGVIQGFREAGHKVCLDDFGAGAAAFHYLRALKVDYVKLDGAYVRKMLVDQRDASILAGMASMCQSLDVVSIAEMVETEEEAEQLRGLGILYGQGWLFGRPAPTIPLAVTTVSRTPAAARSGKRMAETWMAR